MAIAFKGRTTFYSRVWVILKIFLKYSLALSLTSFKLQPFEMLMPKINDFLEKNLADISLKARDKAHEK